MAAKTIFTVGFQLPTKDIFQYQSFHSNTSLLDADIILFEPNLVYQADYINPTFQGKPSLSESSSTQCMEAINHWREELKMAFESGKTIIVFMKTIEQVFYSTGQKQYSGTGKNTRTTNIVDIVENYKMLPIDFTNKKVANGKNMKFTQNANFLKPYWELVKNFAEYQLYFDHEKVKPLILTKSGDKIVGGMLQNDKGGTILLLPPLKLPDNFIEITRWSKEAIQFGKSLLGQIIAIDKALKTSIESTPAPQWLEEKEFQLDIEQKYLDEINALNQQIEEIKSQIEQKQTELSKHSLSKKLLYENGKPLEYAIIDALQTIGFKAENYDDGKSEFDIVFESDEGRFIGEAEGKDNSAINVTKFRQLESNIHEDFERDDVTVHAKGVLFGNPFRLLHPNERKEFFSQKAIDSAKRTGIALVNTHELFEVVKYIKNTDNQDYAKLVRECFKSISGEIIKFPLCEINKE
ncbi:hypothetical protein CP960_06950 [Malaciobacter halophilus]|uniref:Uncharacterized protein n=1 Tax=Malaciobacter halophilus TaxID=197482 RepID=A0A2N1J329_9BACT|nr:hypothetical protein [Malaciobacter halophilus]AXH10587.1 hypothetical protein AHALO_2257 [Malaciobacter halophilus]PKI80968.1 hypothetical protein CP960_06950 [Malaciobacter halophilus]